MNSVLLTAAVSSIIILAVLLGLLQEQTPVGRLPAP